MKSFDLLVIGEINPDLILRGRDVNPAFGQAEKLVEGADLTIGSSSAIMACGAARLGLRTAFVGLVGDDDMGRFMLDAMQACGVDCSACVISGEVKTGLSVILSAPTDRAILTFPGAIPLLTVEQIDRTLLHQARHLHVGGYFLLDRLREDLPTLFAEARTAGQTTSLDTNWDPREGWDLQNMLPHCDVFLPNEVEARCVTGERDLDTAVNLLAARIPIVAVKLGPEGGMVREGEKVFFAPAHQVNLVDTTGAGDSFDAGFLYGFLNDWPQEKSLQLATACGSLSTRAAGGTTAQPTLKEAQALDHRV
jgi:sugar/nucleoside kinase (ribokinase family)